MREAIEILAERIYTLCKEQKDMEFGSRQYLILDRTIKELDSLLETYFKTLD
jgi:hypothetical protein